MDDKHPSADRTFADLPEAGDVAESAPSVGQEPTDGDKSGLVRVSLDGPMHATAFVSDDGEGGTMTVDREGLDVEPETAERLTALAALSGLSLTTKEL